MNKTQMEELKKVMKEFVQMYDDGALCCDCPEGLKRDCGECGILSNIKKAKKLLEA